MTTEREQKYSGSALIVGGLLIVFLGAPFGAKFLGLFIGAPALYVGAVLMLIGAAIVARGIWRMIRSRLDSAHSTSGASPEPHPVEIDPKVRWELHDDQVRERRRSARRWFLTGLVLCLVGFLVGGTIAMGRGSIAFIELFSMVLCIGLIGMIVGMIKTMLAGRLSADVIREVEARRRRRGAA